MPEPSFADAKATLSLDQSQEMSVTSLYRAAIGPISTDYYLPIFGRFEASGRRRLTWNWAASCYTLNWMIFRRLWVGAVLYAAAMLVLPLLLLGLGRLLFQWPEPVELGLLLVCVALSFGLPGLFGNAIFHAKIRKSMAQALSATGTLNEACARLAQQASTRQRFIAILASNTVLGIVLALASVFWTVDWASLVPPEVFQVIQPAVKTSAKPSAAVSTPCQVVPAPVMAASAAPTASAPIVGAASAAMSASVAASASASASAAVVSTPAIVSAASAASVAVSAPAISAPSSAPARATAASEPVVTAIRANLPPAVAGRPIYPAGAASLARAAGAFTKQEAAISVPVLAASAKSPTPAMPKASAARAASVPGNYINVGLFADGNNARNAHAKLLAAGLPAFTQELKSGQRVLTRVRVGPFERRAQAADAIVQIHELQLDAELVKP